MPLVLIPIQGIKPDTESQGLEHWSIKQADTAPV